MKTVSVLLLVSAFALACSDSSDGPIDETTVTLEGNGFQIVFDLQRGRYDVTLANGDVILKNAFAEVEIGIPGEVDPTVFRSEDRYQRTSTTRDLADALGDGHQAEILHTGLAGAPDLRLFLTVYPDRPYFTAAIEAENTGDEQVTLARLVPAKTETARRGGLYLGDDPVDHRILENGSFFLFDFFVDIVPGDVPEPGETQLFGLLHGYQKGHSISNWNHAIRDRLSGRTFVAGSLDFTRSSPMFNTSYTYQGPDYAIEGREPFSYWSAEYPYMPNGKPLEPGGKLSAGPALILPATDKAFDGLESYATAVKQWNDVRLWNERGPENRVPTGWNSWTGSGSSGGYGATIDEQLMLDNLEAMATEFRDFGGEWFQIDDGYEYWYGDWDWREDRFPNGSAWLADQIQAAGLLPGVWIAIFQVDDESETYAQHEADGWFAEQIPLVAGDMKILDLSHPDVLDWIRDRFRKIRVDGYRWVKTDFGYWALSGISYHDPTVTREEAYRRGLQAIQDGLDAGALEAGGEPGDTFWVNVSMLGLHTGYADSIRPNLDTMPAWEREEAGQARKEAQGFKPTVRTIARRYYLQNRVYLFNHDMLFFRSHADPEVPPVTQDEARCLLAAMCLSGSVAKLGEKIVEMLPEWINDYRLVIPVFGRTARPLDLFEREYPEIWHLRVDPAEGLNTHGGGPAYDVVALFNWGTNWDLTTNPYTEMADEERTLSLDLESIGLSPLDTYVAHEIFSGDVLDQVRQSLVRPVRPHSVQVWALREKLDRPQFIGDNRHLLQGAVEVRNIEWSDAASTLTVTYDAAPGSAKAPFVHELVFHVPDGWVFSDATVAAAQPGSLQTEAEGSTLRVSFTVVSRQDAAIVLAFTTP